MKKLFTRFVIFALLIAMNALAATLGGAVGCGGGSSSGGSSGRNVLLDVQYPTEMEDITGSFIAEGTLYKAAAMNASDKVAGPVSGTIATDTSVEMTFDGVEDGKYYLKVLFKQNSLNLSDSSENEEWGYSSSVVSKASSSSASSAPPPAPSSCVCVLSAQERCEQQLWAVVGSSCGGQEEKCKQSIEEGCANDSAEFECNPETNQNCDDPSAVSSQDESTGDESTEPVYQESSAPILASVKAVITFEEGKDAHVSFSSANFDLSYDDDENGVTNLDEARGVEGETK